MMASSVEVDLLRICCNPVSLPMVRAAVLSAERLTRWMMLPCPLRSESSRVAAAFTVGLYIGLPAGVGLWDEWGLTGSLTSHFLEANPPVTMTLDQRLIVPAAGRRALRALAALHRSTGVGALSGPNRESSLSPASWLLHPQGVIL